MNIYNGEKVNDVEKRIKNRNCFECNSIPEIMYKKTNIVQPNMKETTILICCNMCKDGEMIKIYHDYNNIVLGAQRIKTYYDYGAKTEPKKRLYYLRKPELTI